MRFFNPRFLFEMVGRPPAAAGPRALPRKRSGLHRCNACDPKMNDAKAESNHRGQICEALTGTGFSRRENGLLCPILKSGVRM